MNNKNESSECQETDYNIFTNKSIIINRQKKFPF